MGVGGSGWLGFGLVLAEVGEEFVAAEDFGVEAVVEFEAFDALGDGGELAELVDVLDGLGEKLVVALEQEEIGGIDEHFAVFFEVSLDVEVVLEAVEELVLAEFIDGLEVEVVIAGEGGGADLEAEALGRGCGDAVLDFGIGVNGEPFLEL